MTDAINAVTWGEPTMHKPVPMGSKVKIPKHYLRYDATGEVIGVSFVHVIFVYIVLLDKEATLPNGEKVRGVTVPGPELEGLNGENWRLS